MWPLSSKGQRPPLSSGRILSALGLIVRPARPPPSPPVLPKESQGQECAAIRQRGGGTPGAYKGGLPDQDPKPLRQAQCQARGRPPGSGQQHGEYSPVPTAALRRPRVRSWAWAGSSGHPEPGHREGPAQGHLNLETGHSRSARARPIVHQCASATSWALGTKASLVLGPLLRGEAPLFFPGSQRGPGLPKGQSGHILLHIESGPF